MALKPGQEAAAKGEIPTAIDIEDSTPDPMDDPAVKKQVEAARTVLFHIAKGIKQIGMYKHAETKFPEFLQKAFDALTLYNTAYGALTLKVDLTNFMVHNVDLFPEASEIPYKFFKDGIRQLIFREGCSLDELV